MRVVVTGGAGFIGSHLCDALIRDGHDVVCVDNLLTGSRANLSGVASNPRFTFVEHDITKPVDLGGAADWILNLASPASPADYHAHGIHTMKVGALGSWHMLGMAKAKRARYLLASTSEVYGDPLEHPQTESYWGNVNPIGPRGVYDEAKRFAEAMATAYRRTHGVDIRIARIFNTYGPRMRLNDGRAVCNFLTQALRGEPLTVYGDGSQTRSFCYVDDLVAGLLALMEKGDAEPVNLGNPEEVSISELAREVLELAGSKAGVRLTALPEDDPKRRKPDIGRAKSKLGWEPRVPRREGLLRTLEDFRRRLASR